jgi:hypothetical protein
MARLLQTRLPQANGQIDAATYNRLVRVLELTFNTFDPTSTPQYTNTELVSNKFNAGDVVWNKSENVLQVWTGSEWLDISVPSTKGVVGTGDVSSLTVSVNGATTIPLL